MTHPSDLPADNGLAAPATTPGSVGPARGAKTVTPFVKTTGSALGAGLRIDRDMRPEVQVLRHGTIQPDGTETFATTTPGSCLHPFTAVGIDPDTSLLTCGNCKKVVDPDATEEQVTASLGDAAPKPEVEPKPEDDTPPATPAAPPVPPAAPKGQSTNDAQE